MSIRGTDGRMQHIEVPIRTTVGPGYVDIVNEPADLGPEATRHHAARRISIVQLPSPPETIIAEGIRQLAQVEDVKATGQTIHMDMATPGKYTAPQRRSSNPGSARND